VRSAANLTIPMALPINNLAHLYRDQGKFTEAKLLYQRALPIWEQALGREHPAIAYGLTNLTTLYTQQGMHTEAEPLYLRAWYIWKQANGLGHPAVAYVLKDLDIDKASCRGGYIIHTIEKYGQLLLLHTDVLNSHGKLSAEQGRYADAQLLFQRILTQRERVLGAQHPATAEALYDLAACQQALGNRDEALPLYQRALAIREQTLGETHTQTLQTQERYVSLLREMQQWDSKHKDCEADSPTST
jgi:tetratricopeptide (TPR) repeat protein